MFGLTVQTQPFFHMLHSGASSHLLIPLETVEFRKLISRRNQSPLPTFLLSAMTF